MAKIKILSRKDLYDILYGCTILGTGGGGELKEGISLIEKALNAGREFKLACMDEVSEDSIIACPYMCGSISPPTEEDEKKYANLPRIEEVPPLVAYNALEQFIGKRISGVISPELGGSNTGVALYVSALTGNYIIDADPAGRSVPELQHSTFFINKMVINPMAVVTEFGDVVIIKDVVDDFRAEAIVRAIAIVSKNSVGVADRPVCLKELKGKVIPGAISYALKIGKAYRKAKDRGGSVAQAIAKAGDGYLMFRGRVKDSDWEDKEGFTIGNIYLEGLGDNSGSQYRIWFKNENIIAWRNGIIEVTAPDLICVICDDKGEPLTNPNSKIGMNVSVIGFRSPVEWRSDEGIKVFGPRHFGYDIEYVPIEDRIFEKGY